MKHLYKNALLPQNENLIAALDAASFRLEEKLKRLHLDSLDISEYSQKYFGGQLRNLSGFFQLYTYLLAWSFPESDTFRANNVFVDFGGGCGLMALLAKELGIGTVIYTDIYDVSCADARSIAVALNLESDAYVCGDVNDLKSYAASNTVTIDAIASYDVIEHVYDMEDFICQLSKIDSKYLKVVSASSANMHNPLICRKRRNGHLSVELCDREKAWGHKERDSLKSYWSIRRQIIEDYCATLSSDQLDEMASLTRGLIRDDIEKVIDRYLATGTADYTPTHTTNTCDPLTGNWAERLMDTRYLASLFDEAGFTSKIRSGYYDSSGNCLRKTVKQLLNRLISASGPAGLSIAPYYVIVSGKTGN